MQTAREAIAAYIQSKDENRPYLMRHAFDENATLTIIVKSEAISFPPSTTGCEAITDVLVRGFAQTYENVRTFCLSSPPQPADTKFSCPWLVGMSEKGNRMVRVACGRYDWSFRSQAPRLAEKLAITIDVMQVLSPASLSSVMEWLLQLPYPWCPAETTFEGAPTLKELEPVRHWIPREIA
jgi:hypothetical protein